MRPNRIFGSLTKLKSTYPLILFELSPGDSALG